jgi:uncharacterized protein with PQ loop repeat
MEQILSVLYGVSGIAASAFYIPQILKYHRDQDARKSISLFSWGGWIAVTAVTVVYALYVIKSYLVATVAATNLMAQCAVMFYGVKVQLAKGSASLPENGPDISDTIAHLTQAVIERARR